MIVINVDKIRADAEAKKDHKPSIRIILPKEIDRAEASVNEDIVKNNNLAEQSEQKATTLKDALVWDLDNQEREIRIERAKESNKYLPMIAKGASQGELAAHYKKIESISAEIRDIYNKREHVRRYGRLPDQATVQNTIDSGNILALKDQKRSLVNRRSKLKVKIDKGKATNAPKLTEWELQLDQLDAEFRVVSDRINELKDE